MVLDSGSKQDLLVVGQLVDIVSELSEVLTEALDLLSLEEAEYPSKDGGSNPKGDEDGMEKLLQTPQVVGQGFSSILFRKFL